MDDIDRAQEVEASMRDAAVAAAVTRARAALPAGQDARRECIACGEDIPAARRRVLPGVKLCVACAADLERIGC